MRVLLVEDEDPKRDHLLESLRRILPGIEVVTARSVRSAIAQFKATSPDLVLLDMSLPTFDTAPDTSGGRPQGFGGRELMREVDRYGISVPVIVITAYGAFTEQGRNVNLDTLKKELLEEHPTTFKGVIHFSTLYRDWEAELEKLIVENVPPRE